MSIETIKVKLRGTTAMIMHNERLANPLDSYYKRLQAVKREKKKGGDVEASTLEYARIEWEGGLYLDRAGRVVLPAKCIARAVRDAATMVREGKKIAGLIFSATEYPLTFGPAPEQTYVGSHAPEALWAAGFSDSRMVVLNGDRVLRTRPCFPTWSATVEVVFDSTVIAPASVMDAFVRAGRACSVGSARKLGFGKFDVEAVL